MNVLFICTGNTCRSPMAEVIFNETYSKAKAQSRGLYIQRGSKISKHAHEILKREYGYDTHRDAEPLMELDVADVDYIITMTEVQKRMVQHRYGNVGVYTLREMAGKSGDIMDPYGLDEEAYLETFRQIRELVLNIKDFEKWRR